MSKGDELVAVARRYLGRPYESMHNGAIDGQGFGCAMLVAACYNEVFTDGAYCGNSGRTGVGGEWHLDSQGRGCYGSTYNFYGEVSSHDYEQMKMGTWKKTLNPVPGDVICYLEAGESWSHASACSHVALYIGGGRCIGAMGVGKQAYVKGRRGVNETTPEAQAFGRGIVYIHSSLLDKEEDPVGWIEKDGRWWYRHKDGSYTKNGWEKIGGKWYFFDKDGWMVVGWVAWKGSKYYCSKSGAMVTGWQKISGKWYFFEDEGALKTSTCIPWKGKWCAVGKDGAMLFEVKADKDGYLQL